MAGIAQEGAIPAWMINVVNDGGNQADCLIQRIEYRFKTGTHQKVSGRLHDVGGMGRIMIWIVMIVGLDQCQPIA